MARGGASGRRDAMPPGYWDEREAAMRDREYREAMKYSPHNIECEAAYLGALMIDNRLVESTASKLKPDHFFEPVHGRIFERIVSLVGRGVVATPVSLFPYFDGEEIQFVDTDGVKKKDGYKQYLASLTGSGAGLVGARQFAEQIFQFALLRDLIGLAKTIAETAADTETELDPLKVIAKAEEGLLEITEQANVGAAAKSSSFASAWDSTIEEIEGYAEEETVPGVTIVGFSDWNEVCGGMEPGDNILLGGRPSMGKTGVGCAVTVGAAANNCATDFLSLEMKKNRITRRMIANIIFEQGVTSNYKQFVQGKWTQADRVAIANARAAMDKLPLEISDPDSMAVEELIPFIRRRQRIWERRGRKMGLLVIDYLGRLGTQKRFNTETEATSYISRKIKDAARICDIPIITLVQLSRGVEQREDKRPLLSDLRQSGSLEQDADTVIFVYRDEYYLSRSEPPKSDTKKYDAWQDEMIASRDRLELYSTKRREGALTKRTGYFFTESQAVRDSTFYRSDLYGSSSGGFDFSAISPDTFGGKANG